MSFTYAANSAIPSIVGYSALGLGVLSVGSLWFSEIPIIDVAGGAIPDFAASCLSALVGSAILKSREPVAGWLGLGIVVIALSYAGASINTRQASNMLEAAKQAAAKGASTASNQGLQALEGNAGNQNAITKQGAAVQWQAVRPLNQAEIAECIEASKDWTRTPQGRLNCSIATDGKRYVWRKAP
ncbi:MAG: hypothetical protein IPL34_18975 [Thiofilum sp.]|uniref:hypothetical protein n=1 Tax=Thiofilum sp. TaxID=2212733 RepID=UPI0025D2F417|nr:hypothetical protein [Thiofilum sp.]MBK8455370.1 hypothetical protein [Thiofilum sp.]